jgi:hypothetical protein
LFYAVAVCVPVLVLQCDGTSRGCTCAGMGCAFSFMMLFGN